MWEKLLARTSCVIVVVGCGGSDPGGLYAEPDGGASGSYKSGQGGGGTSAGGAPAATGGASSASGASGGSGGSPSNAGGDSAGGEGPEEPPSGGAPTKCKGDKPCAPLICLKKLGVCGPPALPGTACDRDLECLSGKCEEGYCE